MSCNDFCVAGGIAYGPNVHVSIDPSRITRPLGYVPLSWKRSPPFSLIQYDQDAVTPDAGVQKHSLALVVLHPSPSSQQTPVPSAKRAARKSKWLRRRSSTPSIFCSLN